MDEVAEQIPLIDAGEAVVMPGLVASHVHVNELGAHRLGRFCNGDAGGGGGRRDNTG